MSTAKIRALLAVAAIGAMGASICSTAHHDSRDKQSKEQAKALAKKQRVREQIRARRAEQVRIGRS
jgi:hypothetical protein